MDSLFKFQLILWKNSPYVLFIVTAAMLDDWQNHRYILKVDNLRTIQTNFS